ncbi:MAG TPA: YraN family protein, partial [Oscillospiraceae bacterium]|nr:YraN family protein [Oscillospiraceae bacterium]
MDKKEMGRLGEEAVCRLLSGKGFKIVSRNFTVRGGEIDIIAESDEIIAFVEVKTRKADSMLNGFESVTKSKQRLIV